MKNKLNKLGFTLAEMLLAMSIIGVVAALSIPTLNSAVNNRKYNSMFKTMYARLDTSLQTVNASGARMSCYTCPTDNEKTTYGLSTNNCTANSAGCSNFLSKIAQQMDVSRSCASAVSDGCLTNSYVDLIKVQGCVTEAKTAYTFENGMVIYTINDDVDPFIVDLNGLSKPNRWGADIFPFSIKATRMTGTNVNNVGIYPPSSGSCYAALGSGGSGKNATKTTEQMYKAIFNY